MLKNKESQNHHLCSASNTKCNGLDCSSFIALSGYARGKAVIAGREVDIIVIGPDLTGGACPYPYRIQRGY